MQLTPVSRDAIDGHQWLCNLALIHARVGNTDQAISLIESLLRQPGCVSPLNEASMASRDCASAGNGIRCEAIHVFRKFSQPRSRQPFIESQPRPRMSARVSGQDRVGRLEFFSVSAIFLQRGEILRMEKVETLVVTVPMASPKDPPDPTVPGGAKAPSGAGGEVLSQIALG